MTRFASPCNCHSPPFVTQDVTGNNLFEGGFLGLDNVSPFDRSTMNGMHGARLQQAVSGGAAGATRAHVRARGALSPRTHASHRWCPRFPAQSPAGRDGVDGHVRG